MLCKEWSWNSKVTENDSQSQESQLVKNIHLAVSKLFALLLGLGYQNIYKTHQQVHHNVHWSNPSFLQLAWAIPMISSNTFSKVYFKNT